MWISSSEPLPVLMPVQHLLSVLISKCVVVHQTSRLMLLRWASQSCSWQESLPFAVKKRHSNCKHSTTLCCTHKTYILCLNKIGTSYALEWANGFTVPQLIESTASWWASSQCCWCSKRCKLNGWSVFQWPLNMGAAYPCRFQGTLAVDVLAAYTFFGNMCQVWYVVYCMPLPGHSRLCLARHQHISCS